jgi:pyruvate/2-oxoglutarate dehydrogenase complex dihydrolipoamide dehydrogenase (E3) component
MAQSYDVIIIGSGPGGYIAAIRAAQLGLKTAIVEREHLAGICSNWGCIPTKALLRSAEIFHYAKHPGDYGVKIDGAVTADLPAMVARSRGIAARMNGGVGFLMKKNKVDIIWARRRSPSPARSSCRRPRSQSSSRRRRCRKTCCRKAPTAPSTSSSPPVPDRARCPASSRTAS